jgi:hypothetical protein
MVILVKNMLSNSAREVTSYEVKSGGALSEAAMPEAGPHILNLRGISRQRDYV